MCICICMYMCPHVFACGRMCHYMCYMCYIPAQYRRFCYCTCALLELYMYSCRHTVWFLTTVCRQFFVLSLFADTAFGFDVYYELIELFEYCWYPLIYLVFNELLMYWIWYCCMVVPEGAL